MTFEYDSKQQSTEIQSECRNNSELSTSRNHTRGAHSLIGQGMMLPFILVAMLFPLWAFASDITDPLVAAFKDIFLLTNVQSSMVEFAFYLGYGIMAIPAAIFIRKYSYKSGILLGLTLYTIGAGLFIPASIYEKYNFFLLAYCILTFGLALLETTANPYVLTMGSPETATKRLNLAQAFYPIGAVTGMFVASSMVLSRLKVEGFRESQRALHPEYDKLLPADVTEKLSQALHDLAAHHPTVFHAMKTTDLLTIREPYMVIAGIVVLLIFLFSTVRLPKTIKNEPDLTKAELKSIIKRLIKNPCYVEGVITQYFYVGAQITVWTFIIHYGMSVVGITASQAQNYNIAAMLIFLAGRFICTFLLGYVRQGQLLMGLAIGATVLTGATIFLNGMTGLYCLVGISACMSLMFPTIYGIALSGQAKEASIGSAGLVMAILGGAIFPPMQGKLIDMKPLISGLTSVQTSFVVPLICFVVVAIYGYRTHYVFQK